MNFPYFSATTSLENYSSTSLSNIFSNITSPVEGDENRQKSEQKPTNILNSEQNNDPFEFFPRKPQTANKTHPLNNKPAETITFEEHQRHINGSPAYFLGLLLDSEVTNWFTNTINNRCKQLKNHTPVSEEEVRCFIAILFLVGYVHVPRRRMLWERSPDAHCALVANAMQRDRFEAVFGAFNVKDEDSAGVEALIEMLNAKFLRYAPRDDHDQYSIAECCVVPKGHDFNKKSPPNVWCGCSKSGFCLWLSPSSRNSPIVSYVKALHRHDLQITNLSLENQHLKTPLMCELERLGVRAIGMERDKTTGFRNAPLGSIDRFETTLNLYRSTIKGRKPLSSLLTFCLEVALNNAWHLHCDSLRENGKEVDLLAFRRNVVVYYLQHYAKPVAVRRGGRVGAKGVGGRRALVGEARYDGVRHYVVPQSRQTRCGKCGAKTTTRCQKCDVGVHVKCFVGFHTKAQVAVKGVGV